MNSSLLYLSELCIPFFSQRTVNTSCRRLPKTCTQISRPIIHRLCCGGRAWKKMSEILGKNDVNCKQNKRKRWNKIAVCERKRKQQVKEINKKVRQNLQERDFWGKISGCGPRRKSITCWGILFREYFDFKPNFMSYHQKRWT